MSNHKQRLDTGAKPPALTGPEVAHFSMSEVARFSMSLDNHQLNSTTGTQKPAKNAKEAGFAHKIPSAFDSARDILPVAHHDSLTLLGVYTRCMEHRRLLDLIPLWLI